MTRASGRCRCHSNTQSTQHGRAAVTPRAPRFKLRERTLVWESLCSSHPEVLLVVPDLLVHCVSLMSITVTDRQQTRNTYLGTQRGEMAKGKERSFLKPTYLGPWAEWR